MAWSLPRPGLTTATLPAVSVPVVRESLRAGDLLLMPAQHGEVGHVRIFGGWLDRVRSRYWVLESMPPRASLREYHWEDTAPTYRPYRVLKA